MSSPAHIELILCEKEQPVQPEEVWVYVWTVTWAVMDSSEVSEMLLSLLDDKYFTSEPLFAISLTFHCG